MARVLLKNVTKKYDDLVVVHETNLDIKDKEFLVLVGPSGCGKSTTLRMVAGLEEITSGEIIIGDEVVNDIPPKDRDIAMVFQNYALYPHMTVYENLAFALKLRKMSKTEIDARVDKAAKMLGLEELLKRKPNQLSGGQRQRVALGRAVVREPKVFLMDEPLSNLDAKLRVQMRTEIEKLHKRLETTMIYVTHDQTEAMTMGDRIVVLNKGFIQQVDTPLKLYNNPINMFVAGFIGSPPMNFIKCLLQYENDEYILVHDKVTLILDKKSVNEKVKGYVNKEIILGIRPEDFSDANLAEVDKSELKNKLTVTIDVVEPMGSETYVYFNMGSRVITARIAVETHAQVGKPLELVLNMHKTHLFDPVTEENLCFE